MDELTRLLDDAYSPCPSCGQQPQLAGDVYRPHLYCPRCNVSAMVLLEA